jgi:hypothetical protein
MRAREMPKFFKNQKKRKTKYEGKALNSKRLDGLGPSMNGQGPTLTSTIAHSTQDATHAPITATSLLLLNTLTQCRGHFRVKARCEAFESAAE